MYEQSSLPLWSRAFSRFSVEGDSTCNPGPVTICETSDLEHSSVSMRATEASQTDDSADGAGGHSLAMHEVHDCTDSTDMTGATSKHDGYASTTASTMHARHVCNLCGAQMTRSRGFDTACAMPNRIYGMLNTWAPCMACGEGRRALLLGESGEVAKAAYDALGSVLDVHTSDALMHFEFVAPSVELTEVCG